MHETECDLGVLPDGGYAVAVRAFSVDLVGLADDDTPEPELPPGFEVSEQQVGIAVGPDGGHSLSAAVGSLAFGGVGPGLVLWASITGPDGEATDRLWELSVTGPGLPPGSPWSLRYPAGLGQILVWSYDIRAEQGSYAVKADCLDYVLAVGAGRPATEGLELPDGVVAEARGGGGGDVSWGEVAQAQSYAVSVWSEGATQAEMVWWRWTRETAVMIPAGTLTEGVAYDVYVAAADVDMTGDPVPPIGAAVRMSENAYTPARVVGR